MVLVDTSIWVDHLRSDRASLAGLLEQGGVLAHPWVIGELALGNLGRRRAEILGLLRNLPVASVASDEEVVAFIDRQALPGTGIGYVDAQLLAAARLTPDTKLWTADRRLAAESSRLGLAFHAVS